MKIKKGMKVRFVGDRERDGAFKGEREVIRITISGGSSNALWYRMYGWNYGYREEELEITFPYNLEKGDMVLVGDAKLIFIAYRPELLFPFEIVARGDEKAYRSGNKYLISFTGDAKPIPKYKAYTEPNFNWIDKEIFDKKTGKIYIIKGFLKIGNLLFLHFKNVEKLKNSINEDDVSYNNATLYGLFKFYNWSDGTPCGKEIK